MKIFRIVSAVLLVSGLAVFSSRTVWAAESGYSGMVSEDVRRLVFSVHAFSKTPVKSPGKDEKPGAARQKNVGTAFAVGDGYLVTLDCVVRNAEKIQVISSAGKTYDAEVIGFDTGAFLTVLRIDRPDPTPRIRPVKSLKSGTPVTLLGVSTGGKLSLSRGVVHTVRSADGLMVVDIAGVPGTCGTPVFGDDGTAVGLLAYHLEDGCPAGHTAGRADSYIVFPLEYAALQARSIINRFESRSGWLGVSLSVSGLTVRGVAPGSPAEKCGVRTGDRIAELNGEAVSEPCDIVRIIGETRAGNTVRIGLVRNGESIVKSATLSTCPQPLRR